MIKLKSHRLTYPTKEKIQQIVDVINTKLSPADRDKSLEFMNRVTPEGLYFTLNGMRRWYSSNAYSSAKYLLKYHNELKSAMDLSPPIGAYRGFKVFRDSELANVQKGDIIDLPVTRNGGCASFTGKRKIANRFSGKSKDKVGLIIKLYSPINVKTFIAPPSKSQKWFNNLYRETMGKSFRHNEEEYACCFANNGPPDKNSFMRVKIVEVKK